MRQEITFASPKEFKENWPRIFEDFLKPHAINGARARLIWETINPVWRHSMRMRLHGYILPTLAQSVPVKDPETGLSSHWSVAAWKTMFAEMFLPPRFEDVVDGDGEFKGVRKLRSSTEEQINDDDYAVFLIQVEVFCVVVLNIIFEDKD